ncbi:hypothetical protein KCH_13150 [Kitasatospora cheerisanensis KCTC 2395]|uniref:Ketosynthase family 3 (KS3) domain-containing protein n=1 Tax=Kitasatospora cheerisanensis KCTC 2395 TaxID=1348663 RepID=A0A066Z3P7_9ACTN|nr:hypothetical protein KCH_13150 [Kitasatospora cheerisanensis KCTC 2395]
MTARAPTSEPGAPGRGHRPGLREQHRDRGEGIHRGHPGRPQRDRPDHLLRQQRAPVAPGRRGPGVRPRRDRPPHRSGGVGRTAHFAAAAARLAVEDAGIEFDEDTRATTGAIIGTTNGEAPSVDTLTRQWLEGGPASISADLVAKIPAGNIAAAVSVELGLYGETVVIPTACSAANYAIGSAADKIIAGESEVMVAGGADSVNRFTHAGFHSLGAVADEVPQPFDRDRTGIVTAEGGAVLVLEELEHAKARGAHIYAELLGYGLSCDAHHIVHPDAESIADCIRRAHANAGIAAEDVDWIRRPRHRHPHQRHHRSHRHPAGVRRPAPPDELPEVDARPHHGRGQRLRRDRLLQGHRGIVPAAHHQPPHRGPGLRRGHRLRRRRRPDRRRPDRPEPRLRVRRQQRHHHFRRLHRPRAGRSAGGRTMTTQELGITHAAVLSAAGVGLDALRERLREPPPPRSAPTRPPPTPTSTPDCRAASPPSRLRDHRLRAAEGHQEPRPQHRPRPRRQHPAQAGTRRQARHHRRLLGDHRHRDGHHRRQPAQQHPARHRRHPRARASTWSTPRSSPTPR